jgi:hypothetical protein
VVKAIAGDVYSGGHHAVEKNNPVMIAYDSNGIYVQLREKYGPIINDTCTVLSRTDDCFICTHRDGPIAVYPACNYSVQGWMILK